MELDSDLGEIESAPEFAGLSRTLRVADVIRRQDLDFVSKPGELVESEFETGSLSAAGRKAFALMLRKAGPDAGDDKTFVITKKELRGSHSGSRSPMSTRPRPHPASPVRVRSPRTPPATPV